MHWWPSFRTRRVWNPWENCHMLSNCSEMLIVGKNWTTWHSVVSAQNLLYPSQNGQELVTNDDLVWSLTFTTHVNTNNIVMLETLLNNEDWNCFKTLTSQEILKIRNPLLEEHCAFLEVIRLFRSVGCARNKLQFRTVQQNQKSFLWTQDWGWMEYLHLINGIWSSQFFTETRIRVIKHGETCRTNVRFVQYLTHFKNERNLVEWLMIWTNDDFISSNVNSSRQEALLYVFEDNEAVIKMIIKGRTRRWDMFPEPTELPLIGCSTESM